MGNQSTNSKQTGHIVSPLRQVRITHNNRRIMYRSSLSLYKTLDTLKGARTLSKHDTCLKVPFDRVLVGTQSASLESNICFTFPRRSIEYSISPLILHPPRASCEPSNATQQILYKEPEGDRSENSGVHSVCRIPSGG